MSEETTRVSGPPRRTTIPAGKLMTAGKPMGCRSRLDARVGPWNFDLRRTAAPSPWRRAVRQRAGLRHGHALGAGLRDGPRYPHAPAWADNRGLHGSRGGRGVSRFVVARSLRPPLGNGVHFGRLGHWYGFGGHSDRTLDLGFCAPGCWSIWGSGNIGLPLDTHRRRPRGTPRTCNGQSDGGFLRGLCGRRPHWAQTRDNRSVEHPVLHGSCSRTCCRLG